MQMLDVVIIDDEAWTRDTIKRIGNWRSYGYRIVAEASDGISGLQCIRQLQPDLVVTDMKMPGRDGRELLQEIDLLPFPVQVIVVSGYADYQYTRQAVASQAADYLLKPIQKAEFNAILERCAGQLRKAVRQQHASVSLMEFVDQQWLHSYQSVRDQLQKSIDALSREGVSSMLRELELLGAALDPHARLPVLIKMNQEIHMIVEECVISWGLSREKAFTPAELSFVVSDRTLLAGLSAHYHQIISSMIAVRVEENQKKQRIDTTPVRAYIDAHLDQDISLRKLSEIFAVSKEYLSTLFKREQGVTISEYVLSRRMDKAQQLIVTCQIPLSRIPEMVGYMDISHFYKNFKRYFHMTPGAMRDQHASGVSGQQEDTVSFDNGRD